MIDLKTSKYQWSFGFHSLCQDLVPSVATLVLTVGQIKTEFATFSGYLPCLTAQTPAVGWVHVLALVSWCCTNSWLSQAPVLLKKPLFFYPQSTPKIIMREKSFRLSKRITAALIEFSFLLTPRGHDSQVQLPLFSEC